tara:strand:+ start:148 stop:702 length:555 start_codon:yes stop_codon:yes gene_type:complete
VSRGIHADVITELAKDAFNMAHLVTIDFSTTVFLTDYAHDITYGGNEYSSSSHLLALSQVNETSESKVGSFTINLSSVEQTFVSLLLGENYIDREVTISRVILDSTGAIIGTPIPLYNGRIDGFAIKDDDNSSQINLSTASHWSDFEKESGRRTNHNGQQIYFAGDKGFEFASSAVKDIKWGRA